MVVLYQIFTDFARYSKTKYLPHYSAKITLSKSGVFMDNTKVAETIKYLSEQLIAAQKEIRILDAIKWDDKVEADFFKNNCQKLPKIDADYYAKHPLGFNPEDKLSSFYQIENQIKQQLGTMHPAAQIMLHMCQEYRDVVNMLAARGTPQFAAIAKSLYGSSNDAFYVNGPTMNDLANMMNQYAPHLVEKTSNEKDLKKYHAADACKILNEKMQQYFTQDQHTVGVELSDTLVSDAAAGADKIRIRQDAMFSERDLRMLEVHEGWVHLGTTLNGSLQPVCTFLSKGTPSSIITQEGLAVLMELFTFSLFPERVERIISRINAIDMAERGADFLQVFEYLTDKGLSSKQAYNRTVRVFRGSTPDGQPFTKDLAYNKGFIALFNFIRLAIKNNHLDLIPLLFVGKLRLEDIQHISVLYQEGFIQPACYVPYPINDLAALSCWLCYSLFINKLDLNRLESDYAGLIN